MDNFSEEDIGQLRDAFNFFDKNRRGYVTPKNLGTSLRCLVPMPQEHEIDESIEHAHKTKNGQLKFENYVLLIADVIEHVQKRNKGKCRKVSNYKNLTEAQLQELKESFSMFDQDGDGTISMDELGIVMANIGHESTEEELNEILLTVDADNDGVINFAEFTELMTRKLSAKDVNDELREAFAFFDKDGDGSISSDELKIIMEKFGEHLSEEEISEMIVEADLDGDGSVDYSEFEKLMNLFK